MNSFIVRLRAKDGEHAFRLTKSSRCRYFDARVKNDTDRISIEIIPRQKLKLIGVSYTMHYPFDSTDRIFLNGYQSWTYSPEKTIHEADTSLKFFPDMLTRKYGLDRYGDGFFYKGKVTRSVHHGYSYAYVRQGGRYTLFGSLSEDTGFTVIEFNTSANTVTFSKDCRGRLINDPYKALDMMLSSGSENKVFDSYFELLGTPKPSAERMLGYTSWYDHYQDIDEIKLITDLAGLDDMPAKPDVFQIDDGFETFVGDWFDVDPEKFLNGLELVVKNIKHKDLTAGIWLAPFVCEKESKLYREHGDWLLRDRHGRPVFAGGNWSGAYALDFYNGQVREYIRKVLAHYRQLGFKLFKLDFLYAVCMIPRRDKTRGEIMSEAMQFLRNELDGCMILGCGVPLASAFGRVDFCRIGCDMSLDFDDKPHMRLAHAERPSTRNTMTDTVFRRQLSGRAFLNDPDVFLLRDTNTKLTTAQKRDLAYINAMCGGLLFTSDNCSSYSDEAREIFTQALGLRDAVITDACMCKGKVLVTYTLNGEQAVLELGSETL